jgi:hypothetical protein
MGTNWMPTSAPLLCSAQSYRQATAGKNAAPGAVLEAIPRLQSAEPPASAPPAPDVVVDPEALVDPDPAPPTPAPVDPDAVDVVDVEAWVALGGPAPPAPALADVPCAPPPEPQATMPATVETPQIVRSRMG